MPLRILIADDNAVFRNTLRQLLQAADHWEIVEACDGQEAIAKAVETRPDLVILDLAMPVLDGLAAAREISKLRPETPIVMCTMHMSALVEGEAMKSGVRKVLSKSESSLLVETVRQLAGAGSPVPASDSMPPPDTPESTAVVPPPSATTEPITTPPPALPKNVA